MKRKELEPKGTTLWENPLQHEPTPLEKAVTSIHKKVAEIKEIPAARNHFRKDIIGEDHEPVIVLDRRRSYNDTTKQTTHREILLDANGRFIITSQQEGRLPSSSIIYPDGIYHSVSGEPISEEDIIDHMKSISLYLGLDIQQYHKKKQRRTRIGFAIIAASSILIPTSLGVALRNDNKPDREAIDTSGYNLPSNEQSEISFIALIPQEEMEVIPPLLEDEIPTHPRVVSLTQGSSTEEACTTIPTNNSSDKLRVASSIHDESVDPGTIISIQQVNQGIELCIPSDSIPTNVFGQKEGEAAVQIIPNK